MNELEYTKCLRARLGATKKETVSGSGDSAENKQLPTREKQRRKQMRGSRNETKEENWEKKKNNNASEKVAGVGKRSFERATN